MTFFKQASSLCSNPKLFSDGSFPEDVKKRVKTILEHSVWDTVGSFSSWTGIDIVRTQVAEFITRRDGVPAVYEDVFLCCGTTDAVRILLHLLNSQESGKVPGVMVPAPQHPVFSCTIAEYGMYKISYYLNEENHWALEIKELSRAIEESRDHCEPKALVIINPGNPSGLLLSRAEIKNIVKFAYKENLIILVNEVYQYETCDPVFQFYSFKRIMHWMGSPYKEMELASFVSFSKDYVGEYGATSGYFEIVNLKPKVKERLMKIVADSARLSMQQKVIVYFVTNPPRPDEPSFERFTQEMNDIHLSLKKKAEICYNVFSTTAGMSCNKAVGPVYVFPRIHLPPRAIEKAQERNRSPDQFYCMELLESTGICVIPGCTFGQKPGTYHFSLTFSPQMEKLKRVLGHIVTFHIKFMQKYS